MVDSHRSLTVRPSLFDRLLAEPESATRGVAPTIDAQQLRDSVARHLEWLLNSRRPVLDLEGLEESQNSLLTFGLPDLSHYSWRTPSDAHSVAQLIEKTIRRFEPRLAPESVRAEVLPSGEVDDFRLRLRLVALLDVDPVREPVAFDTEIDFHSSAIAVSGTH